MSVITGRLIEKLTGLSVDAGVYFEGIGNLSDRSMPGFLSWLCDGQYLEELEAGANIRGVITTPELAARIKRRDLVLLLSDDPFAAACRLIDYQCRKGYRRRKSRIAKTAIVDPKAHVADYNVVVGPKTVIEAGALVLPGSEIGRHCVIRSGAVLASDNFNKYRGADGEVLGSFSDRGVKLGDGVEIGNNSCIDKGDSGIDTEIGSGTKIHNQVQICHGVRLGQRCLVWGGVFICGFATVEDDVQLQPRVIISNHVRVGRGAFLGINSVVTHDVAPGASVLGSRALSNRGTLKALGERFRK
jgi:UDP-3-O-[3-hydroxymyristoyl] glucosamine N-acyltransferase